jgi:periplasmic divalent cation tolerance protein
MENEAHIIMTSIGSKTEATIIAEKLVETKLAACVQISAQGESIYRWKGDIQNDQEHFLNIKTTQLNKQAVITWLQKHHPYETPEILCLTAEASSAYMKWMRASTSELSKNSE